MLQLSRKKSKISRFRQSFVYDTNTVSWQLSQIQEEEEEVKHKQLLLRHTQYTTTTIELRLNCIHSYAIIQIKYNGLIQRIHCLARQNNRSQVSIVTSSFEATILIMIQINNCKHSLLCCYISKFEMTICSSQWTTLQVGCALNRI